MSVYVFTRNRVYKYVKPICLRTQCVQFYALAIFDELDHIFTRYPLLVSKNIPLFCAPVCKMLHAFTRKGEPLGNCLSECVKSRSV